MNEYVPPKVWTWDKENGGAFASTNRPVAGATHDKELPRGKHPLQLAWEEEDVPQCGYCQAGQIMHAAAFLSQNASPTDEEIQRAMNGNLCRCGTYQRIHRAIKRSTLMKTQTLR